MKRSVSKIKFGNQTSYDFLSKALSCHALCLLSEAGILAKLLAGEMLTTTSIFGAANLPLIQSALITLTGSGVIRLSDRRYSLTEIGRELAKDISMISLPLRGYGKLLSKQYELLQKPDSWTYQDIDFEAIALASIGFGEENINAVIRQFLDKIKPRGTICDLGCGTGAKLMDFCKIYQVCGLGIDQDSGVVAQANASDHRTHNIEFLSGNIQKLKGVWEGVEVVMSNFVFHDLHPDQNCIDFMSSIPTRFPRCRCVIISDIVSYSDLCPSIMPGFDYVHGLQGFVPRDLERTLEIFDQAGFDVIDQAQIKNMKNTFVWLLKSAISK